MMTDDVRRFLANAREAMGGIEQLLAVIDDKKLRGEDPAPEEAGVREHFRWMADGFGIAGEAR